MSEIMLIYGVFGYVFISGFLLLLVRRDVVNKLKLLILSPKGAKLFSLYRKDGTRDEFVMTAKTGGVIERDGDKYAILRSTSFLDRGKNAPVITLAEGNLNSIDPFGRTDSRTDTKQLRALFFAEREKAKADLDPDVKLLKLLVIIAILATIGALALSYFTFQNTGQIAEMVKSAGPAIAHAANATGGVVHL